MKIRYCGNCDGQGRAGKMQRFYMFVYKRVISATFMNKFRISFGLLTQKHLCD